MLRNLFLDAGGVILDETKHEHLRAELTVSILSKLNSTYLIADYWNDVEEAVQVYVPRVYEYVIWKHTGEKELFKKLYTDYIALWKQMRPPLELMQGISDVLPKLSRSYHLGIAGQYGVGLVDLLEENELVEYFKYIATRDDFLLTKPDPRFYEQLLEKAGVEPSESVMIGDRIDKDVIPAKQVGMKTIRIKTGLHRNQVARIPYEIADIEIVTIYEIEDALQAIA